MNKRFKRSFQSLEPIYALTERFFMQESIDRLHLFPVSFAVEELFTNMVKYNADGHGDILLSLDRDDGVLTVSLTDFDAECFDVTQTPDVNTDEPLETRRSGGMGLRLVPRMGDDVQYRHSGRETCITFTRLLAKEH